MPNIENRFHQLVPDEAPDRDHVQSVMENEFVAALLLRGGDTPDEVATRFGEQNSGLLSWLGEDRQDDILRRGMQEAHVDLSHWINDK